MNIYQIIKIGDHHVNFCEDYALTTEIGNDYILAAALDGCSMGNESYFAAALVGKILKKSAKEISYKSFFEKKTLSSKILIKELFRRIFKDLQILGNQLYLEVEDLLTTIIVLVINKRNWSGEVLVVGDGLISNNGQLTEFEQNNKPDYLGYHLDKNFEEWFDQQEQKVSLENIEDISISTDGIFTFKNFDNEIYEKLDIDLIDFLLNDKSDLNNPKMLLKKLSIVEEKWGLRSTDDLGIVRIIK